MFNTWRFRQRTVPADKAAADESEVLLLREAMAYLQGDAGASAPPDPAPAPPPDSAEDGTLTTAQLFIAEQRKIAESLLREVCSLEAQLEVQARAARAAREYAAAKEQADAA